MTDLIVAFMRDGDFKAIEEYIELLDSIDQYIYKDDENCLNMLHLAVGLYSEHRDAIVKLLIKRHADLNCPGRSGNTTNVRPLHIAAMWGYNPTVKLLLHHGADASLQDTNGLGPIDYASIFDNYMCISLLLRYGSFNSTAPAWSAIMDSSLRGSNSHSSSHEAEPTITATEPASTAEPTHPTPPTEPTPLIELDGHDEQLSDVDLVPLKNTGSTGAPEGSSVSPTIQSQDPSSSHPTEDPRSSKGSGPYVGAKTFGTGTSPDHPRRRLGYVEPGSYFRGKYKLETITKVVDMKEPSTRGLALEVMIEGMPGTRFAEHFDLHKFNNGLKAAKDFLIELQNSSDPRDKKLYSRLRAKKCRDWHDFIMYKGG